MKTSGLLVIIFFLLRALATAAEAPIDFRPLFNGVNLVGWTVASGHGRDWRAENGEMVVSGRSEGGARILRTAETYSDFELRLEFKLAEGGNSGVFLRMDEEEAGMEIQLLDDYAPMHEGLKEWQYTGPLYGVVGPARRVSEPAGEWQSMIIRLEGRHLTIVLNDAVVVETSLDSHERDEVEERRKGDLKRPAGSVGLQNYGVEARFRNLSIRLLDDGDGTAGM